jgi:hypothetical protein
MNRYEVVDDITAVLDRRVLLPTVVRWNRLEGRPRTADIARALRAEVRDALWMLAKQQQLGEFRADDAGSPVTAKLSVVRDPVTALRGAGGAEVQLDGTTPLEALVERRPVPATIADHVTSLDIRLLSGRHWVKLLRAAGLPGLEGTFRTAYPVVAPDPDDVADYVVTAHAAAWQAFAAIAGRVVDGLDLYLHLVDAPGNLASDGLGLTDPEKGAVDDLGAEFAAWFTRLYLQPAGPAEDSWVPSHLEYAVGLTVDTPDGPRALVADEYHGGHLDWYSVDTAVAEVQPVPLEPPAPPASDRRVVSSFFPTGARFDGMPNTRWWTFEEGQTNFGDVQPDTTDLGKLLLIEFGLVYGNDWFLAPLQVPLGTVTRVDGLAVTNVFGERTWVEPASARDESWRSWGMFTTTERGGGTAPGLVLLTTTPTIMEGRPTEGVQFVRDEVANLVWAVETTVQLPDGSSRRGREAATELHRRYQDALDGTPAAMPPEPPNEAAIRYRLMTGVDENWIPFVPVHIPGDTREIQLRRASMPRLLTGATGTPEKIRPRTVVLRPGPDDAVPPRYDVYEEEISHAGEVVRCSWQRTRWTGGRVCTWLGLERRPGRGEASSGLAFDRALPRS